MEYDTPSLYTTDEIKDMAKSLRELIIAITEEFMSKGEQLVPGSDMYFRRSGFLFNPKRYALKINSMIQERALKILKGLYRLFPYFSYEHFEYEIRKTSFVTYFRSDYGDWCELTPFKANAVDSLIELCETLDHQDTIEELQKPLYVASAYMFSKGKNLFSEKDFVELRKNVLKGAIELATKEGWIEVVDKGDTYMIVKRPDLTITCPFCDSNISAYNRYCPVCELYLLNMIMRSQKKVEEDIPHAFFERKDRELIAYFLLKTYPLFEFDLVEENLDEFASYKLRASLEVQLLLLMQKLTSTKLATEIPNYKFSSDRNYTKKFGSLRDYEFYDRYYKIKGESVNDIKQKLDDILDVVKDFVKDRYYELEAEPGFKFAGRKEEFCKRLLNFILNCFYPRPNKHPILYSKI